MHKEMMQIYIYGDKQKDEIESKRFVLQYKLDSTAILGIRIGLSALTLSYFNQYDCTTAFC